MASYQAAYLTLAVRQCTRPAALRRLAKACNCSRPAFPTPRWGTRHLRLSQVYMSGITHLRQSRAASGSVNLWEQIRNAPREPGVYLFQDTRGDILYIGKAVSLRDRVRSYVTPFATAATGVAPASGVCPRIASMIQSAQSLEYIVTLSEAAALALEASLVREHRPRFNVLLKDDKRHPYVLITMSEEYPRVVLVRNPVYMKRSRKVLHGPVASKDRIYGPFVNESRIRGVLKIINDCFPLRQRAKPLHATRPCLNYEVGRCPGPCQRLISPEDYRRSIIMIDKLLSGRLDEVLQELEQDMATAVASYDFESAAALRDRRDILRSGLTESMDVHSVVKDVAAASSIVEPARPYSQDIVASVAGIGADNRGLAKVMLFQRRAGSIVGRLVFTVQAQPECESNSSQVDQNLCLEDLSKSALSAALVDHYDRLTHPSEIPDEIILASPTATNEDATMLAAGLSAKRGKAVRISSAGRHRGGVQEIVLRNAEMEIKQEQERRDAILSSLSSLASMLTPHFESVCPSTTFTRIECFDVSHVSGMHAVGSMAVITRGNLRNRLNRQYPLGQDVSSLGHPDDYESLKHTLLLRFSDPELRNIIPDLIVVDGGKGQLSSAVNALNEAQLCNIPIVALAKREEHVFVPNNPLAINAQTGMSAGVRLLCLARDEAHRTAVAAHRRLRGKATLQSALGGIVGLGKARMHLLLQRFPGGSSEIATQSAEDLAQVPGIGPALAQRIYDYFAEAREHMSSKL